MTRLLYAFALGWVLHITYLWGASDGAREAESERSALVDLAADQLAEADADLRAVVAEHEPDTHEFETITEEDIARLLGGEPGGKA